MPINIVLNIFFSIQFYKDVFISESKGKFYSFRFFFLNRKQFIISLRKPLFYV